MSTRLQVYLICGLLALAGIGLTAYKSVAYGYPLTRAGAEDVWTVEAEISFRGTGAPVRASFALPRVSREFTVLRENFASPGYGFTRSENGGEARAVWTRREAEGPQTLYYRVQLARQRGGEEPGQAPADPPPPYFEQPQRVAAASLITAARERSADPRSLATQLLYLLNNPGGDQNVEMLLRDAQDAEARVQLPRDLLAAEGIATRMTRGIRLVEGRRFQPVIPGFELWDGNEGWVYFDPATGAEGKPHDFFLWQRGGVSLLDLSGGEGSQVRFSVLRESRPLGELARERAEAADSALINFSIYELPIEEQNVFKRLMLVPFGALVIVFLRNVVGATTSGTFMPILIALAFQETRLLPGIVLFVVVVGSGLAIRALLSHLNLLVVARVSAVVIVVIGLMAFLSLVSYRLDLPVGMKVTFFPMIIIAWTIERLSILWEEEGARPALLRGGGSLLVAVIAYLCMNIGWVRHATYTFPELLLVVLAATLLLGTYSGYRLTELRRFLPFAPPTAP